jgi:hypothetical protein
VSFIQVTRMQWQLNHLIDELVWARSDGRGYMAMLRAVVLAYEPGDDVNVPLDFPDAVPRFGEIDVDMHALEGALIGLGVAYRARRDLIFLAHQLR